MAAFVFRYEFSKQLTRFYPCAARKFSTTQSAMGAYDAEFTKAKERLNTLKEDPGNEVKLKIYALFKQATVGKCNTPKPGMMDLVGKYKWNAWNDLGNMSQDEAQQEYIKVVKNLAAAETQEPVQSSGPGTSSKFETLAVSQENGIYKITLNRPSKKNAINLQMYEEWISALKEAAEDKSVVLAVVTGSGDFYCSGNDLSNFMNIPPDGIAAMAEKGGAGDYYCSGNDLSNFRNIPPDGIQAMAESSSKLLERFVNGFIDFPKPLIGLVNGPAVGVSVTVLGLFDAVYASDRATFHTPFSILGQSPEGCSSYTFPKLMGAAKASELLLFNKKITAAEAFNRNLITEVIPDGVFDKETRTKVETIAKFPRESMQFSKVLIRSAEKDLLHRVNKEECRVLVERWQSNECMMAIMNFFQQKSSKL